MLGGNEQVLFAMRIAHVLYVGKMALIVLGCLFVLSVPFRASAGGFGGMVCAVFGHALWPFGICEEVITYTANPDADADATSPDTALPHVPDVFSVLTNIDATPVQPLTPLPHTVSTFSSVESLGTPTITEVERALDERLIVYFEAMIDILEVMKKASEREESSNTLRISRSNNENTREAVSDLQNGGTLTDTSLAGNSQILSATADTVLFADSNRYLQSASNLTYTGGRLGIGTSSPSDLLSVSGAVYLGATVPASTNNRLYNQGGDLYWNGAIIGSSSASVWSSGSGNVFFTSGNVGIGTTTPAERLAVDGSFSAATSTLRLVDTGGEVCNVEAYGAVGDNSTINDAAIAAAIAACGDGGTVYFPMGEFRISTPIVLDRPVTLRGAYSPRWSYSSTPRSSIRADFGSFTGVAMVHVRDRTISGEVNHNNGGRLEYISLDGGSASSGVEGIYFEGLVRDWKLTDVDISQVTGNGFEAAVGTGEGNPRGFTIRGLSIYSADGHGFRATALNDSYIDDLLSVGNALRGIYLSSMGETKIANSRAVFNGLTGLYIDGSSNNGGITFTDFSTDRNDRHGVRIAASGTSTIIFNGLLTRRDGPNTSGGSETPYAGVAIIGSSSAKVAPVFISGLGQTIGVDDVGDPPLSPSVGVRVTNAEYVKIDGQLWGVDDAWSDDGGNDYFIIEDDAILKTGNAGAQELFTNETKWQATSTGLYYGNGTVSIGSSTNNTRLFNIIAPNNAGARFQDTTNNVIFDMRAEDSQAFFGSFSNHDIRFQTNNTSRLTIEADGSVGIGTTSPTAQFHTTGSVRFSTFGVGTLTTDANGNVTASSDERLKAVVGTYTAGLDEVLAIEPIRYNWNEDSGFDLTTTYAGFSAQNIELVLPEAVGEDANGFLTLSDRPILAAVVNAIGDLWEMVTGNQERIEALEARVEALETELGATDSVGEDDSEPEHDNEPADEPTDTPVATSTEETDTEASEGEATNTPPVVDEAGDDEEEASESEAVEPVPETPEEAPEEEPVEEEKEVTDTTSPDTEETLQ